MHPLLDAHNLILELADLGKLRSVALGQLLLLLEELANVVGLNAPARAGGLGEHRAIRLAAELAQGIAHGPESGPLVHQLFPEPELHLELDHPDHARRLAARSHCSSRRTMNARPVSSVIRDGFLRWNSRYSF